jgi:nucleoside-diphosphate-sugar epimerase
MLILVTGGTGFVGRQVVKALLAAGHGVHVAARSRGDARDFSTRITFHLTDLLQGDAARDLIQSVKPDTIIHLAWCVEPGKFWTDPANLAWLTASIRLAYEAVEAGVKRFVGVGTCYEYDWPDNGACVEGVTPLVAHTPYDKAKSDSRAILRRLFFDVGVQFSWARVFFPYGVGEDPRRFVPSVARALLRGEPARCTRGFQVRDLLDVREAGAALAAVATSAYCGDVNIASGQAVSLREVAERLALIAGRHGLLDLGALPDRPDDPPHIVADTRILRDEVGFDLCPNLDAGLRLAVEYWARAKAEHAG